MDEINGLWLEAVELHQSSLNGIRMSSSSVLYSVQCIIDLHFRN